MTRVAVAFVCLLSAAPALAYPKGEPPEEVAGAKDHPMFPRFPGSLITGYEQQDFQEYELPVAWIPGAEDFKLKTVEGRYTKIVYDNPEKASATEIVRNYANAMEKAGFKTLLDKKLNQDERRLVMEQPKGGKIWTDLYAYKSNETTMLEMVIVEGKAMDQKIELDAASMFDELKKNGRVAIYGINFDTGKATITADSAKVLAEVAKLLKDNAGLKLRIEGHTDNVGASKANLELSKKRAAAVREWLLKEAKLDGARLATDGFGDTKPVGDNATDDGRAKNRRVELVKL